MSSKVETPFPIFTDIDGSPLEDGYVYVGTAGLDPSTNAITVYSNTGLSTVVAQPIRTKSGFPVVSGSPIRIYTGVGNFSLRVANKNNSQVLQDLNAGASVNIGVSLPDGSAAAPSLSNTGDSNTGLYWSAADELSVATGGVQRAVVDSSGNLGVGTSSPAVNLHLEDTSNCGFNISASDDTTAYQQFITNATTRFGISSDSTQGVNFNVLTAQDMKFGTNSTERMRLDSSGNLGVGTSSPLSKLHVEDANTIVADVNRTGSDGTSLRLLHNGSLIGGFGSVSGDLDMGSNSAIRISTGGSERMRLDSSGNLLVGKESADFAIQGTTITNNGTIDCVRSGATCMNINRLTNDGTLIGFYQAGALEGSVSVSTSTVSYNGGHLARWSRMLDGSKPENLLKGTVMSNLDEMVEWAYDETPEVLWAAGDGLPEGVSVGDVKVEGKDATYWGELGEAVPGFAGDVQLGDVKTEAVAPVLWTETDGLPEGVSIGDVKVPYKAAGVEDNEQLNHTAISSVEGDRDVAGVFIAWDDDDEYNDYHLAMVGDVIIRIAEGVEVQRGDLLVSAGDGTAKPLDPEAPLTVGLQAAIVAKVTSKEVSCVYDDGSFCVPCVLK